MPSLVPGVEIILLVGEVVLVAVWCRVGLDPVEQCNAVETRLQERAKVEQLIVMKEGDDRAAAQRIDDRMVKALVKLLASDLLTGTARLSPFAAAARFELVGRIHDIVVHPAQSRPDGIGVAVIERGIADDNALGERVSGWSE